MNTLSSSIKLGNRWFTELPWNIQLKILRHIEKVRLFQKGIDDINPFDNLTKLMRSIKNGNIEEMRSLSLMGADILVTNANEQSALTMAILSNNPKIIDIIVRPETIDRAMILAAENNCPKSLRHLLDRKLYPICSSTTC